MIFAKVLYPDVHKIILELQRTIPIRVKKMDREYRALAGGKMFSTLTELSEMYVFITRGHIEAKKGANEMLQMVASLLAQLSLFCELKIFDATTAGRIAKSLVELEYLLKGKIINKK